jgi:hypothetical protein
MSATDNKRRQIFNVYTQQWELLKQHNFLMGYNQKYVSNYICPICLRHFSPKDLDQSLANPLTLEDAPPKALGGKANTLTCKECNNTLGSKIDSHLSIRLNEMDQRKFLPGTEAKVKVKMGDEVVQGKVRVEDDGTINMIHSKKNNHPERSEEFIGKVDPNSENPFVSIEFPTGTFNPDKLQYAILKTAYMLAFEKFGYSFILDPTYDRLREQLLNPDQKIYPTKFWNEGYFPKKLCGVHFITEQGLESILVVFPVKTDHSERIISAILPLPFNPIDDVLAKLNQKIEDEGGFHATCYPFGPGSEYLTDIAHIRHTMNWIESKRNEYLSKS